MGPSLLFLLLLVTFSVKEATGECGVVPQSPNRCYTSADCCKWDTPEFKMFGSCSDSGKCNCLAPTSPCQQGLRCCDGSICSGECPPAALHHFCYPQVPSSCALGLVCTEDEVVKKLWPSGKTQHGRCLPEKTTTTTTTSTTTITTTSDRCRVYERQKCQSDSDCCHWNTPEYKVFQSCGTDSACWCVSPGHHCYTGYVCCDGSICNGQCPTVGKFHFCRTDVTPNCQSGLTCTVDAVSQQIWAPDWPTRDLYGRCL